MYTATLTRPPSTNHIYGFTSRGGFARSYITKRGKDWFTETGWLLKSQIKLKSPLNSKVALLIEFYFSREGDEDGVVKPIQDALQKFGIITDDKLVYDLHVIKIKVAHVPEEKIIIQLRELI